MVIEIKETDNPVLILTGEDVPPKGYREVFFVLQSYFNFLRHEIKYKDNEEAEKYRDKLQAIVDEWDVDVYGV